MATTPTNTPIQSEKPQDLKFNAGLLDKILNSNEEAARDRFARARITYAGMEAEYRRIIGSLGYKELGDWAVGLVVTARDQVVNYNGSVYKYNGTLPYTITAAAPDANWVNIGDGSVRGDLFAAAGSSLIKTKLNSLLSVARPLSDKLADIMYAEDFGAVADGLVNNTDNTAAFRAAIAAAHAFSVNGGTVRLRAGVYNINGTLTIPDKVSIVGEGSDQTMIRNSALTATTFNVTGINCCIQGMQIRQTTQTGTAGCGILSSGSNNRFHDVAVYDYYMGIYIKGGANQRLTRISIGDCTQAGLILDGVSSLLNDVYISELAIFTSQIAKFALGGFRVIGHVEALMLDRGDVIGGNFAMTVDPQSTIGLRYSSISSLYIDSGANASDIKGIYDVRFVNCWASAGRETASPGIRFTDCANFSWTNGMVFNSGSDGCEVINCAFFSFIGSDFSNNNVAGISGTHGINIHSNCGTFTIQACTGSDRQSHGLFIQDGAANYSVIGNNFGTNTVASIYESRGNAGRTVIGNTGYVTSYKSTAMLPLSSTSMTVNHNLSVTPKIEDIFLQLNSAIASNLYISGVTATTFTVSTSTANAGNTNFSWVADASKSN